MKSLFFDSPLTYAFALFMFFLFLFVKLFFSITTVYSHFFFYPNKPNIINAILSLFFHASFGHLFSNLIFLVFFGRIVEYKLGIKKWLLFFFSAGFISILLDALIRGSILKNYAPIVGASGAISGLAATSALISPFTIRVSRIIIPFPVFLVAWVMLYSDISNLFTDDNVARWAHLAGFFSVLFSIYLLSDKERKKFQVAFLLNLIFFILTIIILFFYRNFIL